MAKRWAEIDAAAGLRQLKAYWTPERKATAERLARERAQEDASAECVGCGRTFPTSQPGAIETDSGWHNGMVWTCAACAEVT